MSEHKSITLCFVCFLICLWARVPSYAQVECRITAARPARTFFIGEQVALSIHAMVPTQQVPYEVRDFSGALAAQGEISLSQDRPEVLEFPRLANGIYYLTLTFNEEDVVQDAFCIIPRPDSDPGDPALWGFQFGSLHEEHYPILAQMGVRYIRFDLGWPEHERQRGVYNMAKADWYAKALKKFGLQMLPTLGYSPNWTAQKPDDLDNGRSHTWPPDAVEDWVGFIERIRDRLADETISWPSEELFPSSSARETRPLVRGWEIWNEADQNFYYGPWARYCDLLRTASETLKQHSHHEKVVYGGACAHWTEMGKTYAMNAQYYFDQIAWHSNGDIERELPKYYYGAPQLGFRFRLPRPTVQTECYPIKKEGVGQAAYLMRLYATLKAWREEGYCYASIGRRLFGDPDPDSRAMVYQRGDQFIPNAKYVAYAVTRHLLAAAAYVGPVDLGDDITAHLFAKRGRLLLIAWSDGEVTTTINTHGTARMINVVGRVLPVHGPRLRLKLGPSPTVVTGVAGSYFGEALEAYFTRYLNTPYGFEYPVYAPYARPLHLDVDWHSRGQTDRMIATLQEVVETIDNAPAENVGELDALALDLRHSITRQAQLAVHHQVWALDITLWRLQKLCEWLADVQDALADSSVSGAAPADPDPWQHLEDCRAQVVDDAAGTLYPLCELIIDRGFKMAEKARRTGGHGAYLAAMTAAEAGVIFRGVEKPKLTKVFVVAYFPTARQMIHTVLHEPGQEHQIDLQVYNFTTEDVTGTVSVTLPDNWPTPSVSVDFSCPAGGHTERMPCKFTVPTSSEPWTRKWSHRSGGPFCVSVPDELSSNASPVIGGRLADGRELLPVAHEVSIGKWVPGGHP